MFGAGVGAAHVPQGGNSICGNGADDLNGVAFIGRAGISSSSVAVMLAAEHTQRMGATKAYDCFFPESGVHTFTVYHDGDGTATTIALNARTFLFRNFLLGLEAGRTLNHSWHVGPNAGIRVRPIVVDVQMRRHAIGYDEVVRQYTSSGFTEISRTHRTRMSWGWIVRFTYETR